MAYTRNWASSDPSDATLVVDVDTEIIDKAVDIQERVDRILTDGGAMSPPATFTAADTRFATNVDPCRIRGDRVDLQGCTSRSAVPVTDANLRSSTVDTFAAVTGHQIIMTPASVGSIIELVAELLIQETANDQFRFNTNLRGETQWYNTTDAAVIGPTFVSVVGEGQGSGNANGGSFYFATIKARVTGISGAHTFDIRHRVFNTASSNTIRIRGDLQPSYLYYVEHI